MATNQPIAIELLPSTVEGKPEVADNKKKKRAVFSPQRIKTALRLGSPKLPSPVPQMEIETYNPIPLYLCFQEEAHMQELLAKLEQEDLEAWSQFDKRRYPAPPPPPTKKADSFEMSVGGITTEPPLPSSSRFIDSFIALLLQSSFEGRLENDSHKIIQTLMQSQQCPDLPIFRRVCVQPSLVANNIPEIDNPGVHGNIPINQLARFCDIAVVKFLSTATEHTSSQAVMWALQYIQNLLNSLITSLNTLSTSGWYGAPPMRIRKGTTTSRHSVTHPPLNLAVLQQHVGNLPEVNIVAGTPPTSPRRELPGLKSFLDPETGQRSPIPSPDQQQQQQQQQQASSAASGRKLLPHMASVPSPSTPQHSQDEYRTRSKSSGADDEGGGGGGGSQRRKSRQEPNKLLNPFHSGRSQSHSEHISSPRGKRGFSPPTVASIPEEASESSPPSAKRSSQTQDTQFDIDVDDIATKSPTFSSSRSSSSSRLETLQKRSSLDSTDEDDSETKSEAQPSVRSNLQPAAASNLAFPEEHSDTDDDEVRSKLPSLKSPEEVDIPPVNVQKELDTFLTAEGRISLLAILQAISKLPQNPDLWSNDVGLKCFSVIQLCMNLGLAQADENKSKSEKKQLNQQDRRQRFRKQGNIAFNALTNAEKPCLVHSRKVVEFATNALIQCAVNVTVGCVSEPHLCRISHKHLPNQSRSIHDKLIHNLRRIHVHRACFRQALVAFAQPSGSSCRKLFHFLHVVLQYCHRNREGNVDSLLMAIVSAVLRIVVDRLGQLDLNEETIQNSIVAEACGFFQYAYNLFSTDWVVQTKDFSHLHMYIHRIALSVILPPRLPPIIAQPSLETSGVYSSLHGDSAAAASTTAAASSSPPPPPSSTHRDALSDTLPRKKLQAPNPALRKRAGSLNSPFSTKVPDSTPSPQIPTKLFPGKSRLTKQASVHSDGDGEFPPEGSEGLSNRRTIRRGADGAVRVGGGGGCKEEEVNEWRGLRLDTLRSRIQRLNVLLQTSEPGTVPDAAMLASLIDLCDGTSVVARSMVLLECAMFVSSLRATPPHGQMPTVWLSLNKDGGHAICLHLSRWGEAIGEKLRLAELKEKEMLQRLRKSSSEQKHVFLPEEPVFPDVLEDAKGGGSDDGSRNDDEKFLAVSYAVKMSACILLLEITRFLRDPPPQFAGPSLSQMSTPRVSVTHNPLDRDRKPSSSSIISSDIEGSKGGGGGGGVSVLHPGRTGSHLGAYGSSLSVEEPEAFDHNPKAFSFDDNPPSPRKRRVSFVVRVNSQSGSKGGGRVHPLQKPSAKYEIHSRPVSMAPQPSPTTQQRKSSFTASSLGPSAALQASPFPHGRSQASIRHRPSFAGGSTSLGTFRPLPQRRKSMGSFLVKQSSVNESSTTAQRQHTPARSPSPGPSGKLLGTSFNQGLSRLKKSAQAFRRRVTKRGGELGSHASSPRSSPGLPHRKWTQRLSTTGSFATSVTVPPEDSRRYYPWLDIVEHLILVDACDAGANKRHKRACKELISALKNVYDSPMPKAPEFESKKPGTALTMSRSLSRIFYHHTSAAELQDMSFRKASAPRASFPSLSTRRKRSGQKLSTLKLIPTPNPGLQSGAANATPLRSSAHSGHLAALTFTDYSSAHFRNCFLGGGSSWSNREGSIELYLEEESAFSTDYLRANGDKQRREYLLSQYNGLMHAPFSVLVHAAAILHPQTFSQLKEVAWNMLLDVDQELARSAAAFFLLACAKESPHAMERFVKDKVGGRSASPQRRLEAVLRFRVLWHARYHVWPRMEERKKFKMYSEEDGNDMQSIGYSLPANLLGSSGGEVPLAPWKPASVCRNHSCADNPDKCYRPTQLAPVVHREDITTLSEGFSVSGVSIGQEASSKSSNIEYFGVESEDATGNVDFRYEAVDRTFFPLALMSLIRFIIMSLRHPSTHCTPSPPSPPSQSPKTTLLDVSEQAREVVWTCLVEDPRIFFRPLLNQFNKLYKVATASKGKKDTRSGIILADVLQQMHTVLQVFPSLPPNAAHLLFNNFVGVIMRHTDQPCHSSARIIQSVLTLVSMVVPSVQGLDCKVLKGTLKKESCYTTIMTTARIRGVEKVYLALPNHSPHDRKLYEVAEDMNFGQLIASAQDDRHLMVHDPGAYYLQDEGKDLPVLSCLTVQDLYSTPSDGQYPTFVLQRVSDSYWPQQMEELFLHKMSEMSRVLFSTQLLLTGPDVEKGLAYSEYAQPNSRFIHNELVELNSFPRKALTSVLYEAGPGALQRVQLKASDVMLKGMWVEFILQLFKSVKPEHDWGNSMILFLNVINGSLLLYSENHNILRLCLACLLTAACKFHNIFKKDGYLMIVPTLIQVYALHMRNKVITNAVKFMWAQFYLLDNNNFLLQAVAASATVLSEEAALLSRNIGTTFTILSQANHMESNMSQRNHAKAIFELLEALNVEQVTRDSELDLLSCCPTVLDCEGQARLNQGKWERLKLQNSLSLCVTLATWNPEVLRGMQVLVFLNHLMPLFMETFGGQSAIMTSSVRYLIKGCEALSKFSTWRGEILTVRNKASGVGVARTPEAQPTSTKTAPPLPSALSLDDPPSTTKPKPARKTSEAVIRFKNLIINPNRKAERGGGAGERGALGSEREGHHKPSKPQAMQAPPDIITEFKQRRVQDTNQRVLRLARESLLELSAQFVEHFNSASSSSGGVGGEGVRGAGGRRRDSVLRPDSRSKSTALEAQHLMVLTATAVQLLKQGGVSDVALQGKGLNNFMSQLLPKIEWTETLHFTTFNNLLSRLCKLCRKFQHDTNKALLVRENLATFITGVTMALRRSPQLVTNHDQNFAKLKLLLDILVAPPTGGGGGGGGGAGGGGSGGGSGGGGGQAAATSQAQKRKNQLQKHLLDGSPLYFTEAVVSLAGELITATRTLPQQRRFHISDLLPQKVLKDHESLIMKAILLPLCIQLGFKDHLVDLREDANFVLELLEKYQKKVYTSSRDQQQQLPEPFFRLVRVVCCAFEETFGLQDWHRVAQLLSSLAQRKVVAAMGKKSSIASLSSGEGGEGVRLVRGSRLSSNASISSTISSSSPLENFLTFHEHLLGFFDAFLLAYHSPLYNLLWPLLTQLDHQLQSVMQAVKAENPVLIERITLCISRCQALQAEGAPPALLSRHKVLRDIEQELKDLHLLSQSKSLSRSKTTVERRSTKKVKLRTHSVSSPLVKIGEDPEEDVDMASAHAPAAAAAATTGTKKSPFQHRPTFIRLRSHRKEEAASPLTPASEKKERGKFPGASPRRQKRAAASAGIRPQDSLDVESSPIIIRRSPKLAEIGRRFGSSECHADDEDVDGYSDDQLSLADVPIKHAVSPFREGGIRVRSPDELVLPNAGALSRTSPLASRRENASNQLTVSVEVHDVSSGSSPLKDSLPESFGGLDTSEMLLLPEPSPPTCVKRLTSPYSKNTSKSLGDVSSSISLEGKPHTDVGGGGGGLKKRSFKNATTPAEKQKKPSSDRKGVSWKAGLSESTPFIYGCDGSDDASFC